MNEQILDPDIEFMRLRKSKKNQEYLAKKLNRTQGAISQAFQGDNKRLLNRIRTHLNWLENKSKNNGQNSKDK